MATELSNQVYTAPQAPDYLGHYADLLKSIPNAGLQFLAAQKAAAENQKAQAEYQILNQKAKSFMELYPAFKAAQIAKLQAETATYPYRQDLLASQAAYQRAHAQMYQPPPPGTESPFSGFKPGARPGTGAAPDVFTPRGVLMSDQNPPADGAAIVPIAPGPAAAPVLRLGGVDPYTLPELPAE